MLKFFRSDKKEYNYFTSFEEIARHIVEVAEDVSSYLKHYELSSLGERVREIHKIERAADQKKKEMMRYLYQDFLPPIEREDIIDMVYALDTVVNNIEDILIQVDMYQIKAMSPDMQTLLNLIKEASNHVSNMMSELSNFKNPKKLLFMTEEIIKIEEQADVICYQAIKEIHVNKIDSLISYRYSKIYDVFETSFDSFEYLVNVVEAIILKNT